ncbi:hypothetical protein ACJIZ3_009573 [Penstemon smallii]|uniref:Clp R domain-containing protein n=1 Tax=Penstemon smallii TaxID=265156 RepID=A0ABD3TDE9_9LAMI
MPTPVSSARQCLASEAAAALDEAVSVAQRRGHPQTTSLHMISSLLSLPSSSLRETCTRTSNSSYSNRVQFKALELCLNVSLERMPCSSKVIEEPPVSNSLMAAIKRSQANQRRQPENFNFYQQQQQYCSSVPVVKVELQNLILSILDDPLVSRVFGEAGFRSCDVKMGIIRPGNSFYPNHVFGCTSRYKRQIPPLFLCNDEMGSKGFNFPFVGCFSDENSRRIGEVMVRNKKRNPVLLGVSAIDALRSFLESVKTKIEGVLPLGLSGLCVICVKDEILKFLNGDCDEGLLELRFGEVERILENVKGNGVLLSFGDLKVFCEENVGIDVLRYLVSRFTKLIELHRGKLWLIGGVVTHEIYFKFLNKFPSIEEDWDLEILPITSLRFSMGGSYPRSSLMDSFVPLGGFFSMPSDTKSPLSSNAGQYVGRCNQCNEKYKEQVTALSNGGVCASIAEQCQSSLPSWLQIAESSSQNGLASIKAKDDSLLLNAKIAGLQKKWDNICQHHNHNQFPRALGFQVPEERKENTSNSTLNHSLASSSERVNKNVNSSLSTDLQQTSLKGLSSLDMLSKTNISDKSHHFDSSSTTSVNSVTTDLGLGIYSTSLKDPKLLYKALVERVSHQEEAISALTKAITQRQMKSNRGDVWINLRGPDRLAKRKLGVALAEILYGSRESLIFVDLSFQNETIHMDKFLKVANMYDLTMRCTVVDYLVEKLSKKPSIVFLENVDKADLVVQNSLCKALKTGKFTDLYGREVNIGNSMFLSTTKFIENGENLSNGKYSEEEILRAKGNLIQILIRFDLNDDLMCMEKGCSDFLLMNKRKIIVGTTSADQCGSSEVTKRAHKGSNSYLDLNFPAEGSEICSSTYPEEYSDSDSSLEKTRSWLETFDGLIDGTIILRPFDFDTLGEKLYEEMSKCLHKIVGSKCLLEIESKVMLQLLAVAYLLDENRVEDWIFRVLGHGFVEAMGNFSLDDRSIVKLVTCEGSVSKDDQFVGLLPGRIIVS